MAAFVQSASHTEPTACAQTELVSVVIPAFNAANYVDRTLRSVRAQTHSLLEILVIDDGSTDETSKVVLQHAAQDTRVRLIRQSNSGVAAARNRGIFEAAGQYIAPIDADDLWAVDKIELQLRAARSGGVPAGLVYSWYVIIDEHDWIKRWYNDLPDQDEALRRMCRNNFVGSGSSPLLLRSAVIEAGGYDQTLRDRDAQGCEDYKLYFAIIERYPVVLVRAYLTAYRIHFGNMSSDTGRMLRSRQIVTREIISRRPDFRRELEHGHVRLMRFVFTRCLKSRDLSQARLVMGQMFHMSRQAAIYECGVLIIRGAQGAMRTSVRRLGFGIRSRFVIGNPMRTKGTD